jgi:hypothetical protein
MIKSRRMLEIEEINEQILLLSLKLLQEKSEKVDWELWLKNKISSPKQEVNNQSRN